MIIKAGYKFVNLDLVHQVIVLKEILEFRFPNEVIQITCHDEDQAKKAFDFIESKIVNPNSEFADINQYLKRN